MKRVIDEEITEQAFSYKRLGHVTLMSAVLEKNIGKYHRLNGWMYQQKLWQINENRDQAKARDTSRSEYTQIPLLKSLIGATKRQTKNQTQERSLGKHACL